MVRSASLFHHETPGERHLVVAHLVVQNLRIDAIDVMALGDGLVGGIIVHKPSGLLKPLLLKRSVGSPQSLINHLFIFWEAMGAPADQKPRDRDIITAELDEDRSLGTDEKQVTTARTATVRDPGGDTETFAPDYGEAQDASPEQVAQSVSGRDEPPQIRPFAELPTLPADVSDSFESFKLAILHHTMQGLEEVNRDDVVSTLEALKALALAP